MTIPGMNFLKTATTAAGIGASTLFGAAQAQEKGPELPSLPAPVIEEAQSAPILLPPVLPQERKAGPEIFQPVPAQAEPKTSQEEKSVERKPLFAPGSIPNRTSPRSSEPLLDNGSPIRTPGALKIIPGQDAKENLIFKKLDAISAALQAHERHPMNIPIKIPADANTDQKMGAYLNHFKQIAPIIARANGRISEGPRIDTAPIAKTNKQELELELGYLIDAMFNGRVGTGSNLDNRIDILMEVLRIELEPTLADPNIKSYQDAHPESVIPKSEESVLEVKPEPYSPRVAPPLPESNSRTEFDESRFQ